MTAFSYLYKTVFFAGILGAQIFLLGSCAAQNSDDGTPSSDESSAHDWQYYTTDDRWNNENYRVLLSQLILPTDTDVKRLTVGDVKEMENNFVNEVIRNRYYVISYTCILRANKVDDKGNRELESLKFSISKPGSTDGFSPAIYTFSNSGNEIETHQVYDSEKNGESELLAALLDSDDDSVLVASEGKTITLKNLDRLRSHIRQMPSACKAE